MVLSSQSALLVPQIAKRNCSWSHDGFEELDKWKGKAEVRSHRIGGKTWQKRPKFQGNTIVSWNISWMSLMTRTWNFCRWSQVGISARTELEPWTWDDWKFRNSTNDQGRFEIQPILICSFNLVSSSNFFRDNWNAWDGSHQGLRLRRWKMIDAFWKAKLNKRRGARACGFVDLIQFTLHNAT